MCRIIFDKVPSHQLSRFVLDKVPDQSMPFNVDWYFIII
jgi:hypothetical protein